MKPWNAVNALKEIKNGNLPPGMKPQEAITHVLKSIPRDSEFWPLARLSMDPFITFGIKKLHQPESHGAGGPTSRRAFECLTEALSKRELTGNRALQAVKDFAESVPKDQWEWWYERILKKNLDCGMGSTTFNNHAPKEHRVYEFACNLATDIKKVKEKHFPKRAIAEAKYDGVRVLWFVRPDPGAGESTDVFDDGPKAAPISVNAYSRNGKEFFNFVDIASQLKRLGEVPGFPAEGIVIDGEVISSSFNALMSQARRETDVQFTGSLLAFDVIPMSDFIARRSPAPLHHRRQILRDIVTQLHRHLGDDPPVVDVSYGVEYSDFRAQYEEVMDFYQQQVEAGFEGIIVKDLESHYIYDRGKNWLKLKPTDTWDLRVAGMEEGKGRLVGRLGKLVCEGKDHGTGVDLSVRVGSGLSDVQRDEFWKNPEGVIGRVVEVMADVVSQNTDGTHSLRFPRFVRFRDDKS
jgi:DNA ligase-1